MRIKQTLWVFAALVFVGVLYAPAQTPVIVPSNTRPTTTPGFVPNEMQQVVMQGRGQERIADMGPVPLSLQKVLKEIKKSPAEIVIKDVMDLGVDFEMNASIEKKLRKANASDQLVDAVRQAGPREREQMAKLIIGAGEAGFQSIPKEQAQAFDAIKVEVDADKEIALVDDFIKKYPDSPVLSYAYGFGANAYQQKTDVEKVVEYSGKGLKLKPDNIMCLIFSIAMLPMPQYLNAHPADREKILQEAESDANRALQLIPKIPKQPNETDAHYQKRLADLASEVHGPLGMIHLNQATQALQGPDKAELAKAEQEFTAAVTTASHPDPRDYYRLGEAYKLDGKWDNALQAFTKASELGQGTMVKTYADEEIAQIKKTKTAASAAPKS